MLTPMQYMGLVPFPVPICTSPVADPTTCLYQSLPPKPQRTLLSSTAQLYPIPTD